MQRFHPPPGWPAPPPGWLPPAGWQPDPSWPPAPPGWRFWSADEGPRDASTRCWAAEITRLADRRRVNAVTRVRLVAPPVKGGLLGRIVAIGVGAALGGSVNDAALDAADQPPGAHGAVRLPDTCLLCGLQPGTVDDTADITLDTSTLGFFLGGELLSQQKVRLAFHLCDECADRRVRTLRPLEIQSYRQVGQAWLLSLLFLNDRVAESVRTLNRPRLITTLRCLTCGFSDDDQAWLAREDVCPNCHTLYAGGPAWLCPRCGKNLPTALLAQSRKPSTRRQALWGGVDCPRCGADVPKP